MAVSTVSYFHPRHLALPHCRLPGNLRVLFPRRLKQTITQQMLIQAKEFQPVRLNTGGDSASALRALRNGAPHTGAKGEKEGRRNRGSGANCVSRFCVCEEAGTFPSAALLFPPLSSAGKHHSAANAVSKRNLQQKAMSFTESRLTVQAEKVS